MKRGLGKVRSLLLSLSLVIMLVLSTPVCGLANNVKSHHYNTNNGYNTTDAEKLWDICKAAVIEFQEEINLIGNILIGIFLIAGAIVFIINCIRLAASDSHPLLKRKMMISFVANLLCFTLLGGVAFFAKFVIFLALGI